MGEKNTIEMKVSAEEANLITYLRSMKFGEIKIEVVNSDPKKGFVAKEVVQWIRFDRPASDYLDK